jgi:hypothetical protein
MAAITPANMDTAMGTTGATQTQDDLPLFEAGQTVFNVDDFPASASGSNADLDHKAYTISEVVIILATESTVTKVLDQSLAFATPATADSGGTTRAVFGWAHTTTPAATTTANTASSPWFYNIIDSENNVIRTVHQTKLTNQASIETYIAAEIAGWWA